MKEHMTEKAKPEGQDQDTSYDKSEDDSWMKKSKDRTDKREPFRHGLSCLGWGPGGYHLIASEKGKPGDILQLSFVKSSLATNPNLVPIYVFFTNNIIIELQLAYITSGRG